MSIYPYSFQAEIERFGVGKSRKVWYYVLFLPDDLRQDLPFDRYPRLRVEGEIADIPISNAFIPAGDGRNYVIVSQDVRDNANVGLGDRVEMRFRVADQEAVDVPEILSDRLHLEQEAERIWSRLTAGKKRGMAHYIASAKTDATRTRRTDQVVVALLDYNGDLRSMMDVLRKAQKD